MSRRFSQNVLFIWTFFLICANISQKALLAGLISENL